METLSTEQYNPTSEVTGEELHVAFQLALFLLEAQRHVEAPPMIREELFQL